MRFSLPFYLLCHFRLLIQKQQILPGSPPPPGHPHSGSQFHPSLGLYSEPVYSFPASSRSVNTPPPSLPPPLPPAPHHLRKPMSLYGTLPRRPPRPVTPTSDGDPSRYATYRGVPSIISTASDVQRPSVLKKSDEENTNSGGTTKRIRWSREDLLLCTPKPSKKKSPATLRLTSKAAKMEEDELSASSMSDTSTLDAAALGKDPPLPPRRTGEKPPAPLPQSPPPEVIFRAS